MADPSRSANLPAIALVALAALTGGFLYYRGPLQSSRPAGSQERTPERFEKVHARLWEDPLVAMRRHRAWEKRERGGHELRQAHGIDELWKGIEDPRQKSELLVLPVMIAGGPYAEDHESRLRARYAVLSALGSEDYTPGNAAELPYFLWSGVGPCQGSKPQGADEKVEAAGNELTFCYGVPYEWWTRRSSEEDSKAGRSASKSVLILWLRDELYSGKPFEKLAKLEQYVLGSDNEHAARLGQFSRITTQVVGPRTSDRLFEMLREFNCGASKPPGPPPLSPWATYPLDSMRKDLELLECPGLGENLAGSPVERTVLDDRVVLRSLLRELGQRTLARSEERKATLVVVSEWDTLYGRRMVQTLEALRESLPDDEQETLEEVVHFTYLRGLDGRLPGEPEEKFDESNPEQAQDLGKPVGRSRLDYALRLAEEIEDRFKGKNVSAIGVLGSDFYDKILILQALRGRFSRSIFFTTDLDARYLHASHLRWSRNLLVGSSYGLTLHGDETHPPFRESYQTSLYRATRQALGEEAPGVEGAEARVYEIGRTQPVLLMRGLQDAVLWRPLDLWGSVLLLVCFSGLVLWVLHLTVGLHDGPWRAGLWTLVLPGGIYAALFYAFDKSSLFASWSYREPLTLLEGVSIWPTEFLRVLSFGLSLFFLAMGIAYLKRKNQDTATKFEFGAAAPRRWKLAELPNLLSRAPRDTPRRLWHEYADRTGGIYCAVHVLVLFVLYFAAGIFLMKLCPQPMVPYRGPASRWFDLLALYPSIVAMIVLIMYVLYQTLLCRSWLRALIDVPDWAPSKIGNHGPFESTGFRVIRLVGHQTRIIGKLTYFPFFVVFLMILSRTTYFDRWDWPIGLIIIVSLNSAYLLACALVLRWEAERVRRRAVRDLQGKLIVITGEDDRVAKKTQALIDSIQALEEGAFAPLSRHPVFGAFLWPIGGIGFLAVFDQFMRGF